jgi:predicted sugar kinase
MHIELTSPACLLLGLARQDGQICQIGITLQYPQIQLVARDSAGLSITGARADLAHRQAAHFFQQRGLPPQGEIEIELAIPQFMGLGSAAMLGLSVAQALSAIHNLPASSTAELAQTVGLDEDEALETHAFASGGVLTVGADGALLRRHTITHQDEADDWVFVFVLPKPPGQTPERLEAERRSSLRGAARHLSAATARVIEDDLWPAIERDDIDTFAQALARLQALNHAALASAGRPATLAPHEQALLDVMRDYGALVGGRSLTGMGLYGLIKGGGPSRDLRRALIAQLGIFGGTVMATLCDNIGATAHS